MDLSMLEVDLQKEVEGAWVQVDSTTRLLIARNNSPRFLEVRRQLLEPYVRAGREATTEEALAVLCKAMAKAILLGWEGLTHNGKKIEYSEEKALEILQDERFKEFRELVMREANRIANYRTNQREAIEKNL